MKKYMVEHRPTYGSITVEIDETYERDGKTLNTGDVIKDMVDFWTGSERRLSNNDGDYTAAFLKQLCEAVIRLVSSENLNLAGVLAHFAEDAEGYCDMDGSFGIKITDMSEPDMSDDSEFEITNLD